MWEKSWNNQFSVFSLYKHNQQPATPNPPKQAPCQRQGKAMAPKPSLSRRCQAQGQADLGGRTRRIHKNQFNNQKCWNCQGKASPAHPNLRIQSNVSEMSIPNLPFPSCHCMQVFSLTHLPVPAAPLHSNGTWQFERCKGSLWSLYTNKYAPGQHAGEAQCHWVTNSLPPEETSSHSAAKCPFSPDHSLWFPVLFVYSEDRRKQTICWRQMLLHCLFLNESIFVTLVLTFTK